MKTMNSIKIALAITSLTTALGAFAAPGASLKALRQAQEQIPAGVWTGSGMKDYRCRIETRWTEDAQGAPVLQVIGTNTYKGYKPDVLNFTFSADQNLDADRDHRFEDEDEFRIGSSRTLSPEESEPFEEVNHYRKFTLRKDDAGKILSASVEEFFVNNEVDPSEGGFHCDHLKALR